MTKLAQWKYEITKTAYSLDVGLRMLERVRGVYMEIGQFFY